MHALALFLSLPNWHDFIAQTPVHIVAIAVAVKAAVSLTRKLAPEIDGRWVVLLNLLYSVAGVFIGMKPENVFTETTVMQLAAVVTSAGGIHAIWTTLSKSDQAPEPKDTTPTAAAPAAAVIATMALLMILPAIAGCAVKTAVATPPTAPAILPAGAADTIDATANQTLQTIYAFMTPIVRDIQGGKLNATQAQRDAINKLDMLYNVAIVAEKEYHGCMLPTVVIATYPPPAPPTSAACLAQSGITVALQNAQAAFTAAQTAIVNGISH